MKNIGLIRRTDKLGRIVIPKELRDFYCVEKNETLEILATENGILIRKPEYEMRLIKENKVNS